MGHNELRVSGLHHNTHYVNPNRVLGRFHEYLLPIDERDEGMSNPKPNEITLNTITIPLAAGRSVKLMYHERGDDASELLISMGFKTELGPDDELPIQDLLSDGLTIPGAAIPDLIEALQILTSN